MIRQDITLGTYRYIVDMYSAFTDDIHVTKNYVMLRRYDIINNLCQDRDIFFIEKSLYDDIKNDASILTGKIVIPVPNSNNSGFSSSFNEFNSDFTEYTLFGNSNNEYGIDVYPLYNKNNDLANIECDLFRIYHPGSKPNIDAIVYIDNYVNNIHFHYICNLYSSFTNNSKIQFNIENEYYGEYIDVYVPSTKSLFPNLNNIKDQDDAETKDIVYFKENLDIIKTEISNKNIQSNFTNKVIVESYNEETNEYDQLIPVSLLAHPYIVEQEQDESGEYVFKKLYIKYDNTLDNGYVNQQLLCTIFPYSRLDNLTHQYIMDDRYEANSDSFINASDFSLRANFGFANGIPSIICKFSYPEESKWKKLAEETGESPLRLAYKYYNNISEDTYSHPIIGDSDDPNDNMVIEDWEEDYGIPIDFIGYTIEIATDNAFRNIIYKDNKRFSFELLDDFAIHINSIFNNWKQLPDQLIVKTTFYDMYVGKILVANFVAITKERFKYLINNFNIFKADKLKKANDDMKGINLSGADVNFLNSIKCIVNNKSDNTGSSINRTSGTKILYKPIFYKVQELQNIRLRERVTQNIGINLVNYMTKVETFKLVIDNMEIVESQRNEQYVIFSVNAISLSNTSGTYDIVDQDGTYISSGTWSVF